MKNKNKVGRPKLKASEKKEPTTVRRVPTALNSVIDNLIKEHKTKQYENSY